MISVRKIFHKQIKFCYVKYCLLRLFVMKHSLLNKINLDENPPNFLFLYFLAVVEDLPKNLTYF